MQSRRAWLLMIFVFGMIFFSFSWNNPFVFDDILKIKENADLKPGSSIAETLLYPYKSNVTNMLRNDPSRPLTFLIYRFCYSVADGKVWPFHLVSTLFHVLSACLVYLLVGLITRRSFLEESPWPGVLAAFFFLLLPINSGTVFYAYAFSDVLATYFLLASLYVFNISSRPSSFAGSLVLFACALMSKQSAIVLPALIVLTDIFLFQLSRKRVYAYAGFFAMALVYLLLRYMFFGGIGDLEGTGNTFAPLQYFQLQGFMILKYLQLAIAPWGLALDHAPNPNTLNVGPLMVAWFVILFLSGLSLLFLYKRTSAIGLKLLSWFWLFFILTLLPTSSFVPTVDLLVERRAYFGSFALAAVLGILLTKLRRPRVGFAISFVVLLIYAGTTWARGKVYSSPEKLWQESVALYPTSKRAQVNLGVIYDEQARYEEAIEIFEKVRSQYPGDAFVQTKVALTYQNPKYSGYDLKKSLEAYQKALDLNPNDIVTLYNAGLLMIDLKNYLQAEMLFRRSLEINPRFAYGMMGLGMALVHQGRTEEGKKELKKSLEIDPHLTGAQVFLQQLKK